MSSPDNSASKQAAANEQQRQANIASATSAVNNIFDSPARTGQYSKLAADTTAYYTQQLDQQQQQAQRNTRFALARNGQTGGSVATDAATQLGKDYDTGVLNAARAGSQAGASLQASDQQQRANLIAAAQGGLSATDAASQASSAMQSGLATAKANATNNALADTFSDFSNLYSQSQNAKQLRNGYLNAYNTVYQPGFGAGASRNGY
jgi:hypothetical protein